MRDQNEFMRQMLDLVEFAKTNENRITKEQVDDFCQDMKLQKSQLWHPDNVRSSAAEVTVH